VRTGAGRPARQGREGEDQEAKRERECSCIK
jgi:hypothetical protein